MTFEQQVNLLIKGLRKQYRITKQESIAELIDLCEEQYEIAKELGGDWEQYASWVIFIWSFDKWRRQ